MRITKEEIKRASTKYGIEERMLIHWYRQDKPTLNKTYGVYVTIIRSNKLIDDEMYRN